MRAIAGDNFRKNVFPVSFVVALSLIFIAVSVNLSLLRREKEGEGEASGWLKQQSIQGTDTAVRLVSCS